MTEPRRSATATRWPRNGSRSRAWSGRSSTAWRLPDPSCPTGCQAEALAPGSPAPGRTLVGCLGAPTGRHHPTRCTRRGCPPAGCSVTGGPDFMLNDAPSTHVSRVPCHPECWAAPRRMACRRPVRGCDAGLRSRCWSAASRRVRWRAGRSRMARVGQASRPRAAVERPRRPARDSVAGADRPRSSHRPSPSCRDRHTRAASAVGARSRPAAQATQPSAPAAPAGRSSMTIVAAVAEAGRPSISAA